MEETHESFCEQSLEEEKNRVEGGTLYLTATPIGNLDDLTDRAKKILREVDFIAAEDTRVTAKILRRLDIQASVLPYHEHNKRQAGTAIVGRLKAGESCALVTDAGTPGISDPGADLVALCAEEMIPVTALPGPCAAINALILSGLDTRRFCFEGFLEGNTGARRKRLEELSSDSRTLILYETPHDLRHTLSLLLDVFGNRRAALCRELTKRNEEITRITLAQAVELYRDKEPRGEYVLILAGASLSTEGTFWEKMTVAEHVAFYQNAGLSKMDAMKAAAKDRHIPKGSVYQALLREESEEK